MASSSYRGIGNKKIAFIDQFLVSGSNFFTALLLAKYLGIDGFGYISLMLVVVIFFAGINFATIGQPMLSAGDKRLSSESYLRSIIQIQALLAFLLGIAAIFVLWIIELITNTKLPQDEVFLVGGLVVLTCVQDGFRRLFFSTRNNQRVLVIDMLNYFTRCGVLVLLVFIQSMTIKNVLVVYTLALFLSLFSIIGYEHISAKVNFTALRNSFTYHWQFSKWLVLSSLIQWASGNAIVVAAAATFGVAIVGAVKVVQNIFGLLNVFILALENFVPINAKSILKGKSYKEFRSYIIHISIISASISLAFILMFFLFKSQLLGLFGEEYLPYSDVLLVFVSSYVFVSINPVLKIYLRTLNQTKYIFMIDALVAIATLTLVYPALSYFGEIGVGIGQVLVVLLVFITLVGSIKIIERTKGEDISSNAFI